MGIITKITVQKNNKDRYNIFVDKGKGEEYAFSVDEDVLIKFQMKKGMDVDEFSVMEIQYQDDIRKAYNLAIHYLSRRMRTEKEVRDYLAGKEVSDQIIQEAIHKLYHYKFLNDEEYANAFVRTQINTSDKGPELIKRELREKGITENLVATALKPFTQEIQVEKAVQLAEKMANKNTRDSERIIKQKLEQLLVRKGYSYGVISIALEEVHIEKEADEQMDALRYQGEKLQRKYSSLSDFEYEQKMKQSLFRKGFPMDLVERFLQEDEED